MEPQQPGQLGHNPYDFILNPPKTTTEHPLGGKLPTIGGGSGKSFGLMIGVILGGAFLVMIILALVVSALTGNKLNTAELTNLVGTQVQLIDFTTLSNGVLTQTPTQELSINAQLTLETDRSNLVNFLASEGIKVNAKILGQSLNATTALELHNAQNDNTVDSTFAQVMQSQLQSYATTLKQMYGQTGNAQLKKLLSTDYTQAELLLREVPSASPTEG